MPYIIPYVVIKGGESESTNGNADGGERRLQTLVITSEPCTPFSLSAAPEKYQSSPEDPFTLSLTPSPTTARSWIPEVPPSRLMRCMYVLSVRVQTSRTRPRSDRSC